MKFLTGDDTGLLKLVRVEGKKIERLGERRKGDAIHRICGLLLVSKWGDMGCPIESLKGFLSFGGR